MIDRVGLAESEGDGLWITGISGMEFACEKGAADRRPLLIHRCNRLAVLLALGAVVGLFALARTGAARSLLAHARIAGTVLVVVGLAHAAVALLVLLLIRIEVAILLLLTIAILIHTAATLVLVLVGHDMLSCCAAGVAVTRQSAQHRPAVP